MMSKEWSCDYYLGALDAYGSEVEALNKAFSSFGDGRLAQFKMMYDDLKNARAKLADAVETLGMIENGTCGEEGSEHTRFTVCRMASDCLRRIKDSDDER